jgi:hypothetical protein
MSCLVNSYIHTARGLVKVQDLVGGDQILTPSGFYKQLINTAIRQKKRVVKIITDGCEFLCFENTHIAVMKSPTEIIWKLPHDLIYGVRLVNPKKPCEGIYQMIDKNRAWFIGLVQSLSITNNFFSLITNPVLSKSDIQNKIKKEFDAFNCSLSEFAKFIESMGKTVPTYIYSQSLELRLAYLSGLTDSQHTIWPLEFTKEIQLLMYSCGLQGSINKIETGYCLEPNAYSYNLYKKIDTLVSIFTSDKPDTNKSDIWHPNEFIGVEITGEEIQEYYVEVDGGQFYCNGYLIF